LRDFWRDFSTAIDGTKELTITAVLEALDAELGRHFFPENGSGADPRLCPNCGAGRLSLKLGKFGAFIGCSKYPECRFTRPLGLDTEGETGSADMVLGNDPATGLSVAVKKGPFGHYIQLGEAAENGEKPKRVALPRSIKPEDVDLKTALGLLSLPREVGRHPETGEPITAGIGRFGPYLKHGSAFASLGADDDVLTIGLNRAVTVLAEAKTAPRRGPQLLREIGPHPEGGIVGLYKGRYGPYVSHDKVYASLPKGADPDVFPLEDAIPLLAAQKAKGKGKTRRPQRKAAGAAGNGEAKPARPRAAAKRTPATGKRATAPRAAMAKAKTKPAAKKKPASRPAHQTDR
jgi:DNA topoisomerase-1